MGDGPRDALPNGALVNSAGLAPGLPDEVCWAEGCCAAMGFMWYHKNSRGSAPWD